MKTERERLGLKMWWKFSSFAFRMRWLVKKGRNEEKTSVLQMGSSFQKKKTLDLT